MIPMNPFGMLGLGKRLMSMPGAAARAFGEVGGFRTMFANRTVLGAIGGAAYGAYRGDDYSASSIVGGALAGAGLARYGGAFGHAMRSGIGMRSAARVMSRHAMADGRRAGRFIANSAVNANRGYNKLRGLMTNHWF